MWLYIASSAEWKVVVVKTNQKFFSVAGLVLFGGFLIVDSSRRNSLIFLFILHVAKKPRKVETGAITFN